MGKEFYKELIYVGFFPKGKFIQPNFALAEKTLNKYKTASASNRDLVDLLLYYVETGSKFMNEFDGIDEDICMRLEDTFEEALQKIAETDLKNEFRARCQEIVANASEGYGFSDTHPF